MPLPVLNGLYLVQILSLEYCETDENITAIFLKDATKKLISKCIKDLEE